MKKIWAPPTRSGPRIRYMWPPRAVRSGHLMLNIDMPARLSRPPMLSHPTHQHVIFFKNLILMVALNFCYKSTPTQSIQTIDQLPFLPSFSHTNIIKFRSSLVCSCSNFALIHYLSSTLFVCSKKYPSIPILSSLIASR